MNAIVTENTHMQKKVKAKVKELEDQVKEAQENSSH